MEYRAAPRPHLIGTLVLAHKVNQPHKTSSGNFTKGGTVSPRIGISLISSTIRAPCRAGSLGSFPSVVLTNLGSALRKIAHLPLNGLERPPPKGTDVQSTSQTGSSSRQITLDSVAT